MSLFITRTTFLMAASIASALSLTSNLHAASVIGNLGGLTFPTGAATNNNQDRQYAWTIAGAEDTDAEGAEITVTYTLSTSNGNLSDAFQFDNLFRYAPGANVPSGQSFTITIDLITVNAGWTLNSVSMSDTVTVASANPSTARFSVNGGTPFDFVVASGAAGNALRDFTNSEFTAFNGVGDTLFFQNTNQTAGGGMNLRNLGMTFDVIPEPSAALLSGLGLLALLRRRR